MFAGCKCQLQGISPSTLLAPPRWGGANSALPHPLTGFEGPFRGVGKREERYGKDGRKHSETNFWLRPCVEL